MAALMSCPFSYAVKFALAVLSRAPTATYSLSSCSYEQSLTQQTLGARIRIALHNFAHDSSLDRVPYPTSDINGRN